MLCHEFSKTKRLPPGITSASANVASTPVPPENVPSTFCGTWKPRTRRRGHTQRTRRSPFSALIAEVGVHSRRLGTSPATNALRFLEDRIFGLIRSHIRGLLYRHTALAFEQVTWSASNIA